MEEVYHQDTSASVTGYTAAPKILTIELVRRYCCAHPVGTILETSLQKIKRAIGRSAGQLSYHLDKLEADGWIRRLSDHTGTLIEVLRSDQTDDRCAATPAATQSAETPRATDHPHDRSSAASGCDHADDPPACMVDHESHDQQQQHDARARETAIEQPERGEMGRPAGVFPGAWRKIQARNPGYTPADFERELALVRARPGVANEEQAVQLVVGVRKRGEVIYARQEGAPNGRQNAPNCTQRPVDAYQHAGDGGNGGRKGGGLRPDFRAPPMYPDLANYGLPDFARLAAEYGDGVPVS